MRSVSRVSTGQRDSDTGLWVCITCRNVDAKQRGNDHQYKLQPHCGEVTSEVYECSLRGVWVGSVGRNGITWSLVALTQETLRPSDKGFESRDSCAVHVLP
jgi:hypothetical protein